LPPWVAKEKIETLLLASEMLDINILKDIKGKYKYIKAKINILKYKYIKDQIY
jgi:hypothetical protein